MKKRKEKYGGKEREDRNREKPRNKGRKLSKTIERGRTKNRRKVSKRTGCVRDPEEGKSR